MRRAEGPLSRLAKTGEPREKPAVTPASRTWLASHVASAGLEHSAETALYSCTSTTPQDLLYWENSTQWTFCKLPTF